MGLLFLSTSATPRGARRRRPARYGCGRTNSTSKIVVLPRWPLTLPTRNTQVAPCWAASRIPKCLRRNTNPNSETWLGLLNIATRSPAKFSTFADSIARTWGLENHQDSFRPPGRTKPGIDEGDVHASMWPRAVFDRAAGVELRAAGRSWRQIASALSVSLGTARRVYEGVPKPSASEATNGGAIKTSCRRPIACAKWHWHTLPTHPLVASACQLQKPLRPPVPARHGRSDCGRFGTLDHAADRASVGSDGATIHPGWQPV